MFYPEDNIVMLIFKIFITIVHAVV